MKSAIIVIGAAGRLRRGARAAMVPEIRRYLKIRSM